MARTLRLQRLDLTVFVGDLYRATFTSLVILAIVQKRGIFPAPRHQSSGVFIPCSNDAAVLVSG